MDIKLLPRRSFKKPLSFGHFEWEDEMEKKEIEGHPIHIMCASVFEIFEHGDIEHVLAFNLSFGRFDGDVVFSIEVKYLDGKLEQNTYLSRFQALFIQTK